MREIPHKVLHWQNLCTRNALAKIVHEIPHRQKLCIKFCIKHKVMHSYASYASALGEEMHTMHNLEDYFRREFAISSP